MSDNVVGITSRVDFDLDVEESKLDVRPDFYFTRKGTKKNEETGVTEEVVQRIRVTDPNKVDWRILVKLEQPIELLGYIIPDHEDKVFLRENPIPVELLLVLMRKLESHFTLPELGGGRKLPI